MTYKTYFERDLIPQTKVSRRVSLRIDTYGIYFLFWEEDQLLAGDVFQFPWVKNPNLTKWYTWFVWERDEY